MQPLQEKLRWNIDVRPLHRETGTIRFVPTSERRRAIVTCSAIMCATIGVTGYPRSASCPRRRAVALPHSRRRRAAAGSVPSPFLDGPKSVAPTTCANLRASIGVTGYPRSANCPRRRAIALPYSRRLRATAGTVPSPFLDGPKSAPSYACVHLCASIGVTGYPRSANCPRRRAITPSQSRRPCATAGTVPSPFLDGPKSAPPPARVHLCASIGVTRYPRSGKLPAPSRHRSPTFSQTARDSRLSPTAASRWSKSVAPATCAKLACMQSPV
jgi:hypothetical protein